MNIEPSAIESPLALIALFVAIIELFLIYPISKLKGKERKYLVVFIIGYPIFIASAFFVFLWNKPVHLYSPQTLSEELQKALLPESLNEELAPDRAAVSAIELKLLSLDERVAALAGEVTKTAENTTQPNVEGIATLEDLRRLKSELLERTKLTGDISRESLNKAAENIQSEAQLDRQARIVNLRVKLTEFREYLVSKGLVDPPEIPSIAISSSFSKRPSVGESEIFLPTNTEFDDAAVGLYLFSVASARKLEHSFASGKSQLLWTCAYYMAAAFTNSPNALRLNFPLSDPNPSNLKTVVSSGNTPAVYNQLQLLFDRIIDNFGEEALESGTIYMINQWSPDSSLESSLNDMARGIENAGGNRPDIVRTFQACGIPV